MDDGELQCKDDLTALVSDDARALTRLKTVWCQACGYYCEKSDGCIR